jgi:hypothetical protein
MGGFILFRKGQHEHRDQIRKDFALGLKAMSDKGLTLAETIDRDAFISFVFQKKRFATDNIRNFGNGDFIFYTGTLFYKGLMEGAALDSLYRDFPETEDYYTYLKGTYAIVLFKDNNLYIFNDYAGYYHIFVNEDESIFSSSFIAVMKSIDSTTVSQQELFEFINFGACFGDKTIFKEIDCLPHRAVHQLLPERTLKPKTLNISIPDQSASLEEKLDYAEESLYRYFKILKKHFGDDGEICLGITGGFDSRLALALLRKTNIKAQLYVYGNDRSPDVVIAKSLAKMANLPIAHTNKAALGFTPDSLMNATEARFNLLDGLDRNGVFDNGADLYTRMERTQTARLQMNGQAGEFFRNRWNLHRSAVSLKGFVKSGFAGIILFYPSFFTDAFNKKEFVENLVVKFQSLLNVSIDRIDKRQLDQLFIFSMAKLWAGRTISSNNLLTYCLTPFGEPEIMLLSSALGVRDKHLGKFQAKLINRIDPELAGNRSIYGYNLTGDLPVKARALAAVESRSPLPVRRIAVILARRLKVFRDELDHYFGVGKLNSIFGKEVREIRKYVSVDKVWNARLLNRAFTAELLITNRF